MSEYITRERALEILNDIGGCGAEPESYTAGWDEAINAAYETIQSEPAADVAPVVHAHWINEPPYRALNGDFRGVIALMSAPEILRIPVISSVQNAAPKWTVR